MDIIIVNEKDEVIEFKKRGTLSSEDIYRVSALWILNNKGKVLLARRAYTKDKDPGMWGPAVAGTVEKHETYESNIIKETQEELGLQKICPKKHIKTRVKKPHNHFTQWFILKVKKDKVKFKPNEEVAEIKWFGKEDLINLIKISPNKVVNSMRDAISFLPFQ